jgi:chemotaxis protein methyltransferase CheR
MTAVLNTATTQDGLDNEFSFNRADFDRVRKLIYQHAGISLHDGKQAMVYSRLSRRLRDTGHRSFGDYLQWLESATGPQAATEWQEFVNCLTTNLTSFFREDHHFQCLTDDLKPFAGKPLRIWCCAASTGEEPYSIAMTACEAFNSLNPPVQIIATDIDTNVLAIGAKGVYGIERLDKMPAERAKRFFLRGKGEQEGLVRVRPELRQLVTFKQLNLLGDSWPVSGQFDVIFCRNVMIYFDKATQRKILARFVPLMKPSALLFAGHSENFLYVSEALKLRGKTVYELEPGRTGAN